MDEQALAERFDECRGHLRAVAYRMLGSLDEAEDAVQETWLRAARAGAGDVANLPGWLTTIAGRICLDMLRSRRRRGEDPAGLDGLDRLAELERAGGRDPEEEAVLADSVGLAMLVVLDRLGPAERVAFVLHDLFAVPFAEIAGIVERTPETTKRLASRARRRVHGTPAVPAADLARQREVVAAFLAASRSGDLDALLAVLAPDAFRRAEGAAGAAEVRGARRIAGETLANPVRARNARLALVDGSAGVVVAPRGRLAAVLRVTVEDGRIAGFTVVGDPSRLRAVRIALLR
ncbi:sigma-70 family RNA polymerase sigma factor [Actinomadura violacea]|uniref:Sigma-70 family RNA polymerase sigma factor n=1 Tax=Actinomadura violacea TaxID=2819934 RepID=A0ABS3S314_9ACTN|nr:sigma-70 family RNA polymerase sigma factor [Actinomadura violacea]MBO2463392.1 sigma-70 family RNA polymerase sigma factor [Actinomadura violacea]